MPKPTYYEVLELDRHAPTAEVKSHYRRLAKRYHPDLNGGNPQTTQQFREVQAAYEVLSNPEQRQRYDMQLGIDEPISEGWTGSKRTGGSGPRPYRRYDGRTRRSHRSSSYPVAKPTQPRAAYAHYIIEVSLPELFKGTQRALDIGQTLTCRRCRGRGKLDSGQICERCGGYGFMVQQRRIQVTLPPGLQPDMQLRLEVAGEQPEHSLLDAPALTNIAATVQLRETPPFEFRDNQLRTTAFVPANLLAQGGEWTIPAPEGGSITFKVPAKTLSGSVLTLRRHGLRNGSSQRRSNLFCTVIAQT